MPKANFLGQIGAFLANVDYRYVILTGPIWLDRKGISRLILKFFEMIIIYISSKTIADSKSQAEFLRSVHPFFLKKISSTNSISPGQKKITMNREFNKKIQEGLKVGHFGRLSIRKGSDDAIKIATEFIKLSNTGTFTLAGPVEDIILEAQIFKLAKLKSKRINIYNGFFDMYKMLKKIDILLMPSIYEGFGISAIEASKLGVIVLGYDVIGLKDSIIDNITGLKIPYGRHDIMLERLLYFDQNRQDLFKFQKKSYDFSKKEFTENKILGSLKNELNL